MLEVEQYPGTTISNHLPAPLVVSYASNASTQRDKGAATGWNDSHGRIFAVALGLFPVRQQRSKMLVNQQMSKHVDLVGFKHLFVRNRRKVLLCV